MQVRTDLRGCIFQGKKSNSAARTAWCLFEDKFVGKPLWKVAPFPPPTSTAAQSLRCNRSREQRAAGSFTGQ